MTATITALVLFAGIASPSPTPQHIFGGEPAPSCAWPSAVALGGCTGTLIHPEIVVYAAHCGDQIETVWFGEVYFAGEGRAVPTDFCMVNEVFDLGEGNDYAFCKLAEPVTDIPFTPPLMGCETTLLTPGREIALVGFGAHDLDGNTNVKYQLFTTLNFITEGGEAQTGDNSGFGVCFGDSGGPAYIRLDESVGGDASWRAFGIASYITGGCGGLGQHTLIHNAIPFIEDNSGVDVTPCHYPGGAWDPTEACQGFAIDIDQSHGTWDDGCAGGAKTGLGATCGPAHSGADDLAAPTSAIVHPQWGAVFESDPVSGRATFSVTAEASDDASGVLSVGLSVDGQLPEEAIDYDPPWQWPLVTLPSGIYSLRVVARDHSGKEAESEEVKIGVDMEPPPKPEPPDPGSSTGEGSSSGDVDPMTSTGPDDPGTTGDPVASGDSTGSPGVPVGDDGACACRSDGRRSSAFAFAILVLAAISRRPTRRRSGRDPTRRCCRRRSTRRTRSRRRARRP
jgi:hypothetical protein